MSMVNFGKIKSLLEKHFLRVCSSFFPFCQIFLHESQKNPESESVVHSFPFVKPFYTNHK